MSVPAPASPAVAASARPRPIHRHIHFVMPHLLDTVRSTLIVIIAALFIIAFLVQPFRIPSESMERTLLVGDFLLVDKVAFAPPGIWNWLLPYRNIARHDIVVFHFPLDSEEHVVKRVIGVPGDEVRLKKASPSSTTRRSTEPYDVFERADADEYRDQFPRYTTDDPAVDPHWREQMHGLVENAHLRVPDTELLRPRRQSQPQPRQPLLGLRPASKHRRHARSSSTFPCASPPRPIPSRCRVIDSATALGIDGSTSRGGTASCVSSTERDRSQSKSQRN